MGRVGARVIEGVLLCLVLVFPLAIVGPESQLQALPEGEVSITTDKVCYGLGEPVRITASGWARLPAIGDFPAIFWGVTDKHENPVFQTFNPADVVFDFNGTLTGSWNQTYRLANDTPPSGEPVPPGMYMVWFYESPPSYLGWPFWPAAVMFIGDCSSNLKVLTDKDCYSPGEIVNISVTNGGPSDLGWGIPEPPFAIFDSTGNLVRMPGGAYPAIPLILRPNETYSLPGWNQKYRLFDINGDLVPPSGERVPEGTYVVSSWAGWPEGVAGTKRLRIASECRQSGPIAEAGPDRAVSEGDTVHFDGTGSYDPNGTADSWSARANVPSVMFNGGSATLGGELYYAGGPFSDVPDWNHADTFLKYTPANDIWTALSPMPANREFPGVVAVNGRLYVIGGHNGWFVVNTTLEFDPASNTWSNKAPMPVAAFGFAAAVVDDRIYTMGGYVVNYSEPYAGLFEYNTATDTWTERSDMLTPRVYLAAAALGSKVYAIGGEARPPYVEAPTVEAYDPATDTWSRKADMTSPRTLLAAWPYMGRIIVLGGTYGWDVLNSTEIYDEPTDSWTSGPTMLDARMSFGSGVIGDCLYAAGGHRRMPYILNYSEALCTTNTLDYRWDFDASVDSNNDGNYTNDMDATGPAPSWIYGDDGTYSVTLEVTDQNGLTDTDTANITVLNSPPEVAVDCTEGGGGDADVYLRIAGEKWHDVHATLYEDGVEIGNASIVRTPGSPNDQMVQVGSIHGGGGNYSIDVLYTPDDDPINGQPNGATPAWIILKQGNDSEVKLHHTFNVRHPETWNWTVGNLESYLTTGGVTCTATATDPGSDDLTFTWDWGDGTPATATTCYNDGTGPDPYPSPSGTFPFTCMDEQMHTYDMAGSYSLTMSVNDDDGGTTEIVVILIIG